MRLYYKHRVELYRFLGYQEQCGEFYKHRVDFHRVLGYQEQCGYIILHRFCDIKNNVVSVML